MYLIPSDNILSNSVECSLYEGNGFDSVCCFFPEISLLSSSMTIELLGIFFESYFGEYWPDTNKILSIIFSSYSILGSNVVSSSSSFIISTPIVY